MDFHTYALDRYEREQDQDIFPKQPLEPPSYLCEARRRSFLDHLLNRPGELVWDEWIQTIDQWRALEMEALRDGLTLTTDPTPST